MGHGLARRRRIVIRTNLMPQLGLDPEVLAQMTAAAPKVRKPLSAGAKWGSLAALVVLSLGGTWFAMPEVFDQWINKAIVVTPSSSAAPAGTVKDAPLLVQEELVGEVDFSEPQSVQKALDQGKVSTDVVWLGVDAAKMNTQALELLRLVQRSTPSSARFNQITLRMPNYYSMTGMLGGAAELQTWTSALKSNSQEVQSVPFNRINEASTAGQFEIHGRLARPADAQSARIVRDTSTVAVEAQKFVQALKSELPNAEAPKSEGRTVAGALRLEHYSVQVKDLAYGKLLMAIQNISALQSPVGMTEILLKSTESEGMTATLRFAVWVKP
jgi:hypothetical protein